MEVAEEDQDLLKVDIAAVQASKAADKAAKADKAKAGDQFGHHAHQKDKEKKKDGSKTLVVAPDAEAEE